MPRPPTPVLALAAILLAGACATVGVTPGAGGGGPLDDAPPTAMPYPGTGRPATARRPSPLPQPGAAHPQTGAERRVCRHVGWPRDHVAVAYVTDDGSCPRSPRGDDAHTAAIVVPLARQPVGTELEVCADQRVPRDWDVARAGAAGAAARCPGAGRDGEPATLRIRRVR